MTAVISLELRSQEVARPPTPPVPIEPGATIRLLVGQSTVIRAPWNIKRISITDPQVADVQALTPDQVLLMGKGSGSTDVTLWSEAEEVRQARVEVEEDLSKVEERLHATFPHSQLEISRSRDVVIIRGVHPRTENTAQLQDLLQTLGYKYVDLTSVAGVHQVQIQVRVAEVSRTAIRSLGINALHTGPHFFGGSTVGSASGGAINTLNVVPAEGAPAGPNLPFVVAPVSVSPLVSLFTGFPDADLEILFQALAENQYLRVLAEPNLTAMSGEEASFLAGGEFPIPVVQGGTTTGTSITIEYKEFGVRLRFRPTVLGDGTIRLKVAPEVSDLSDTGGVEIQGFRVPSLLTRRAETTLEMKSGQTFALAGLLNQREEGRSSRVPVLGDIPVLGALFRSVRYQSGETEMVVIAKATLVEPTSADEAHPVPGLSHTPPRDWELYAGGRIEGDDAAPGLPPPVEMKRLGFERLRGPGAWASYGEGGEQSRATLRPEGRRPAGEQVPGEPAGPPPGDQPK